ncbi:MAG: 30S ribosomal protein S6 [Candidatus Moranbacteria bacterium]|nr:30S ribosomal protein S6 [Candidatus Moranbacteria bacterium]
MSHYYEYELIFIVANQDFEKLDKIKAKVEKTIKDLKGEILKQSEPQKRKLAYSIKGSKNGIYIVMRLNLEKKQALKFQQQVKLIQGVLRHLLVRADELPKKDQKKQDQNQAKKEKTTDKAKTVTDKTQAKEVQKSEEQEQVKGKEKQQKADVSEQKIEKELDIQEQKELSRATQDKPAKTKKKSGQDQKDDKNKTQERQQGQQQEQEEKQDKTKKNKKGKLKFEELEKKLDDILKDDDFV